MPLVNVMVNGRAYTIACDDGEEDHLRELAGIVDAKMHEDLPAALARADSALYQAKFGGRNQVVVHDASGQTIPLAEDPLGLDVPSWSLAALADMRRKLR